MFKSLQSSPLSRDHHIFISSSRAAFISIASHRTSFLSPDLEIVLTLVWNTEYTYFCSGFFFFGLETLVIFTMFCLGRSISISTFSERFAAILSIYQTLDCIHVAFF